MKEVELNKIIKNFANLLSHNFGTTGPFYMLSTILSQKI